MLSPLLELYIGTSISFMKLLKLKILKIRSFKNYSRILSTSD